MIKFTKMEGLGNDYIYIDCTSKNINNPSELSKKISDRHFGIGSDGLILIKKSKIADFKMQMYNSDGSEAEMCGNGIRCVGKYVYDKGLTNKTNLKIETLAGIKILELNLEKGKVSTVKVDMGEPVLKSEDIPIKDGKKFESKVKKIFYKVNVNIKDELRELTCVSMGNPHAIDFVNDVQCTDVHKYGSIIEIDKHFPKKVNKFSIDFFRKCLSISMVQS